MDYRKKLLSTEFAKLEQCNSGAAGNCISWLQEGAHLLQLRIRQKDQMACSFTFLYFPMHGSLHLEYLVCISIQKEKYIANSCLISGISSFRIYVLFLYVELDAPAVQSCGILYSFLYLKSSHDIRVMIRLSTVFPTLQIMHC